MAAVEAPQVRRGETEALTLVGLPGRNERQHVLHDATPIRERKVVGNVARASDILSKMGKALARSFYARPSLTVARALLGRDLVRTLEDGTTLRARIVECEAYRQDDPASHSYKGRTPTRETMFGPPGHLYVYVSYGMHFCMNVVTGRDGEGSAVLLRAAEPLEGLDRMAELRGLSSPRLLLAGPGRLCQGLAITRAHDDTDLILGHELRLERGRPISDGDVVAGPRVGLTVAREHHWRFTIRGSRFVSRGPVRLPGAQHSR